MANGLKNDDALTKVVGYFNEAEQSTIESREEAEQSRDYYDGKQLTSTEVSTLEKRGQPPIIDNKVKDKIDTLLGMEIEVRTDPKAFPRTPADEKTAQAATDSIRFIADKNRFPQVKSEVGNNMFVEGTGACAITINKRNEVVVNHIMWDRFFYDPHSRRKNFEDAKYLGEAIWLDADDAAARYPDAKEEFEATMFEAMSQFGETFADKPLSKWVDPKRKRVRIVECYYLDKGVWTRALYGRHALLEGPEPSVYLDEHDEPEHPYSARSPYVDRNGVRYGVVRRYKDLQDEHNKRRSKMLHLASARTIVADAGAVDNIAQAKEELKKPDGFLVKNPGKELNVLSNDAEIAAQAQLLLHTDAALSQTGPNAAIQGLSGRISGRAKQLDQQAGAVNLGTIFDGLREWELLAYRKIWNRVRQFWTEEKWIRVRDDERNMKFVPLNKPITQQEAFEDAQEQGIEAPPPPFPNAPLIDANGQVVMRNDIGRLDVDIIIEQAPDIVTIQQEQFQELSQMAQSGLPIPPDVLIEASSLRNKNQLLSMLRGETPEAQQQAEIKQMLDGIQITLEQLKIPQAEAEIEKTIAETQEIISEAEKNEVETINTALGNEKIS